MRRDRWERIRTLGYIVTTPQTADWATDWFGVAEVLRGLVIAGNWQTEAHPETDRLLGDWILGLVPDLNAVDAELAAGEAWRANPQKVVDTLLAERRPGVIRKLVAHVPAAGDEHALSPDQVRKVSRASQWAVQTLGTLWKKGYRGDFSGVYPQHIPKSRRDAAGAYVAAMGADEQVSRWFGVLDSRMAAGAVGELAGRKVVWDAITADPLVDVDLGMAVCRLSSHGQDPAWLAAVERFAKDVICRQSWVDQQVSALFANPAVPHQLAVEVAAECAGRHFQPDTDPYRRRGQLAEALWAWRQGRRADAEADDFHWWFRETAPWLRPDDATAAEVGAAQTGVDIHEGIQQVKLSVPQRDPWQRTFAQLRVTLDSATGTANRHGAIEDSQLLWAAEYGEQVRSHCGESQAKWALFFSLYSQPAVDPADILTLIGD